MLQSIRERAQGVVAGFIVVLISIPFALFGISSYLGIDAERVMATVNGDEILERQFDENYRNFRQNLRERLGKKYNADLLDESILRKQVLDSMIENRVLTQAAGNLGLHAGDEHIRAAIRSNPSFQVAGTFDQQAYERAVRQIGLTPAGYEAQRRAGLVSEQLPKVISGSEFATKRELAELVRLRLQSRQVSYLQIPQERFTSSVEVNDSAVRAHFDANQADYMVPERVKVEYLDLEAASIATTLSVDEETLKGYYEKNKNQYQTAEERRASHILFLVEEDSDEELVRAKAEGTLQRLKDGESFEELAKAHSEDPSSAEAGGDLDYFSRGVMTEAFEDAVFKLSEGELSGVVKSEFGFHLIKLTAIRAPEGQSFDEAKETIKTAYLSSEAERKFYEYAERLGQLVWDDQNSLAPAADALGLTIKVSDWITRTGDQDGLLNHKKVRAAAFSDDVLNEGLNSEAIELTEDHIVAVRVVAHENAAPEAFDAVKQKVSEQLIAKQGSLKAGQQATSLVAELGSGKLLTDLAGDLGQVVIQKVSLTRDSSDTDRALLQKVFNLPRPDNGKPSAGSAQLADGSLAIIVLESVTDGSLEGAKDIGGESALTNALVRSRGRSYFDQFTANLRESAEVILVENEDQ